MDRIIVHRAKVVAAHRGVSVAELLSELVRGPVDDAFSDMARQMMAADKPRPKHRD
jgi:hypothetical protein